VKFLKTYVTERYKIITIGVHSFLSLFKMVGVLDLFKSVTCLVLGNTFFLPVMHTA